jgi:hypothetical protein
MTEFLDMEVAELPPHINCAIWGVAVLTEIA